jgi:hypothetical protein
VHVCGVGLYFLTTIAGSTNQSATMLEFEPHKNASEKQ